MVLAVPIVVKEYWTLRNTQNQTRYGFRYSSGPERLLHFFFEKFATKIKLLQQWPTMAVHFAKLHPFCRQAYQLPCKSGFVRPFKCPPPSGPDGAEISTSRLWQHNSWHSRLRMDRIQWRAAFPPPPWCPCSSWRKSLPTKILPISLPTPLSRPVDQWLVVDWLQVHFYLTINICIILFHPYISSFHSTSLSYNQSILAICRPWPRFTVCRGRTQQSMGEGGEC